METVPETWMAYQGKFGVEAGVPSRPISWRSCKYRNHMRGYAVGETSAGLMGSERDCCHPHRRA